MSVPKGTPKLAAVVAPEKPDAGFAGEMSDAMTVALPPEIAGKTGMHIHDTQDTNPTIRFDDPGDYIIGRYAGVRDLHINDRVQRLYDLTTPSGIVVSVWGATILDSRINDALKKGMMIGSSCCIQYLGSLDTGKQSAAKNFRVVWK